MMFKPADSAQQRGFSLIEILIAIGVVSILCGIVIVAINPRKHLTATADQKRAVSATELRKAIEQYSIDYGEQAIASQLSADPVSLCQYGKKGYDDCLNLDVLVDERYISELPVDPAVDSIVISGYEVLLSDVNRIEVQSQYTGEAPAPVCEQEVPEPEIFGSIAVVRNCSQLQADSTGTVWLANDIDCSRTSPQHPCNASSLWSDGRGFQPLRNVGTLEGLGFTIDSLYIDRPSEPAGLLYPRDFDSPETRVNDLYLQNIEVTGNNIVGGLIALNRDDSYIRNVHVIGSVRGGNFVGGIMGYVMDEIDLESLSFSGSVLATGYQVGGIVGHLEDNESELIDSYAVGNISGQREVGGLVGSIRSVPIANSYTQATVRGDETTGGLVGSGRNVRITDSFAAGTVLVSGGTESGGTLIGKASGNAPFISNSYWVSQTASQVHPSNCIGYNSTATVNCSVVNYVQALFLSTHPVYSFWDFIGVWAAVQNALPQLH